MRPPDPWGDARDRATWENQAWAAGVEWARQLAITCGATYETYTFRDGAHPFADLLKERNHDRVL